MPASLEALTHFILPQIVFAVFFQLGVVHLLQVADLESQLGNLFSSLLTAEFLLEVYGHFLEGFILLFQLFNLFIFLLVALFLGALAKSLERGV